MRRVTSLLVRICISAGILLFLFNRVDKTKISQAAAGIDKAILLLVFLLFFLVYFIGYLRWKTLISGMGLNVPLFIIFRSFCIGIFSNLFFPSTVGGDLVRGIDLGLRTRKPRSVAASLILDRISGYFGLVLVCLLAFSAGGGIIADPSVFFGIGALLLLLCGILAVLFSKLFFSRIGRLLDFFGKPGKTLSKLHTEIYNFRSQKATILKSISYSLLIQLVLPLQAYLLCLALGVRVSPLYFFVFVPIITAISALPFSVGGLGLREAGSMYFFAKAGISAELALTVSLLNFAIIFLLGLCGGLIYVLTFPYRRLQCDKTG
ncbi:lysylphosphatidylglycerol synthase transmembrane domain-containing protein [Candidatus Omnitrophota bacterium]